jgi:hypothetical protein
MLLSRIVWVNFKIRISDTVRFTWRLDPNKRVYSNVWVSPRFVADTTGLVTPVTSMEALIYS